MTDWLSELREEKQQALAKSLGNGGAAEPQAVGNRQTHAAQQIEALIGQLRIEPRLQEFIADVLTDHPLFARTELTRAVFSRGGQDAPTVRERREPEPWSAPVRAGNPLPALALEQGRTVSRVEWRLRLSFRAHAGGQLQMNEVAVSVAASGVQVNSGLVTPPSEEQFQAAFIKAFRAVTGPAGMPGARRVRRQRRKSITDLIAEALFPSDDPTRLYVILIIAAVVILVLTISVVAVFIGSPTLP